MSGHERGEALTRIRHWRGRLCAWIDSARFQRTIVVLVIVNAITLGLEAVPDVMAEAGDVLRAADRILLSIFVVELSLKLVAFGGRFFRSGWNLFDALIIGIALVPAAGPLAVFRALRVLRILRLVSAVPRMRLVVEALARSLPGLGAIGLLLSIFFYVFAVVATKLFSEEFPQWFGSLWVSMFSLFQIMTLEGWADIARSVMRDFPAAWIFFIAFILLATFTVLNLFIALIVKAMEDPAVSPRAGDHRTVDASMTARLAALTDEIAALRRDIVLLANVRDSPAAGEPELGREAKS